MAERSGSVFGAGMTGKLNLTLAFEERWNPSLNLDCTVFIDKITSGIPPKRVEMESILRLNQGRV